uniref:Uncharacterized protein n=1 Tax=Cyanistes caeruleus TaxID=156563 RepID=A0A8C0ZB83_CYACU
MSHHCHPSCPITVTPRVPHHCHPSCPITVTPCVPCHCHPSCPITVTTCVPCPLQAPQTLPIPIPLLMLLKSFISLTQGSPKSFPSPSLTWC